jgi:hypothetical protein
MGFYFHLYDRCYVNFHYCYANKNFANLFTISMSHEIDPAYLYSNMFLAFDNSIN